MSTKSLTQMALLTALLCVAAYITIPIPLSPAPITATVFVLFLIGYLLQPQEAFITIAVYLLIGIAGLPVFAGGTGGIGHFFGPMLGYLLGYLVAFPALSIVKGPAKDMGRYIVVGIFVALPIIYGCGVLGLMYWFGMSLKKAITVGALPFIPLDILKAVIASWLATKVRIVN